jgi:hypothetical protein
MAHVNLYLQDDLADQLRVRAKAANTSMSGYVSSLLDAGETAEWPKDYFEKVCGFLQEKFEEPADPPPDSVDLAGL